MQSMTGFGQCQGEILGQSCVVEMKSVNHRFLETKIRLPISWESAALEREIQLLIRKQLQRGSVQVTIRMQEDPFTKKQAILVNLGLAQEYAKAWDALQDIVLSRFSAAEHQPADTKSMRDLIHFIASQPGVIQKSEDSYSEGGRFEQVKPLVETALAQLSLDRAREGMELKQEIKKWLQNLAQLSVQVEQHSHTVISNYQAKFEERAQALLQQNNVLEKELISKEVALLVAGWDITEELHRLGVHIKECIDLCEKSIPVGKQLDFLIQEIHREINTLGAKSHSAEISSLVVLMKTMVERVREQVQNVE